MSKIIRYVIGIFLVISILAAVGLGVWGYQLNTKLMATQKQLSSLQAGYDNLKTDNTKLNADLAQANSNLDQAKSDLVKAQSDIKASNNNNAAQRSKLDTIKNLMPVVDALFVSGDNDASVTRKVNATGDTKLIDLLDAFFAKPNQTSGQAFNEYLFGVIEDSVK